jgi:DNA invertase Pin-like site-specific DNA recombinase
MSKTRVAAYVRINSDRYGSCAKNQYFRWTKEISEHEGWECAGVYIDVGGAQHRETLQKLVGDCKSGKVDLIVTPTARRFGRGLVDAMNMVRELYLEQHSVGVLFQKENLDSTGDGNIPALLEIHEMVVNKAKRRPTAYAAAKA